MPSILKDHVAEALAGLLVLLIAVWFIVFAWGRTGGGSADSYQLTARFPNASGVSLGSDIRVSGMKVGAVTAQSLDPETYQAVVTFSVDQKVQLPLDSSAAITSDGLLGGSYISLIPGGDMEMLRAGDEITDTQGSTDLMGLIGSFVNRGGGSDTAEPASATPAP